MNTLHRATIALLCAALALAVANIVVFAQRPSSAPATDGQNLSTWQRWQALTPAQRVACVQRYQAVSRRAEARPTWRRVREFRRLPPAAQDRLREGLAVLRETLERQPPSRRRELLRLPARVRAYEIYRILVGEDPARVAQLRAAWSVVP